MTATAAIWIGTVLGAWVGGMIGVAVLLGRMVRLRDQQVPRDEPTRPICATCQIEEWAVGEQ